jgi:hypothetical protein
MAISMQLTDEEMRVAKLGHCNDPSIEASRNAGEFYTRLRKNLGFGDFWMGRHVLPSFLIRWRFECGGKIWTKDWSIGDDELEHMIDIETEAKIVADEFLKSLAAFKSRFDSNPGSACPGSASRDSAEPS